MGGKTVTLSRQLSSDEVLEINELLTRNNLEERQTLVAFIINLAAKKIENKEIARRATDTFPWRESKDPFGTNRALVTRIINDLNQGASVTGVVKKRGTGPLELQRWSDAVVQQRLHEMHSDDPLAFNYNLVKGKDMALLSHIEQQRGNFQSCIAKYQINPLVHLEDVPWGSEDDAVALLKSMLTDISMRCGIDSLNYNSMYQYQSSILGIQRDSHENFEQCRKYGCTRRVSGSAIIRKIENIYGSYKAGVCALLEISEAIFSDQIERKPHKNPLELYLAELRQFIDGASTTWTISQFHAERRAAHHGLHNKKEELTFIKECYGDVMVAAVTQLAFEDSELNLDQFLLTEFDEVVSEAKSRRVSNWSARLEGYKFQELFLMMLTDPEVGLKQGADFRYEQMIEPDRCDHFGHSPRCKMDFAFPNCIVDTKRSVTAGKRITGQTARYLEHTDHLIRVTLRQRYSSELRDNKRLTTMTVFEFIDQSRELIRVKIPDQWKDKFSSYAEESALRIQEALDS
ncbi:MAG: hypothetical protein VW226_13840 [Rhodospirillaceae bacterium]|jgi:hypothetical protein